MVTTEGDDSMRRTVLVLIGTLTLLLAAPSGCSSSKTSEVPDPGPMPEGANFQGVWFSPQFKHMYLRQSGQEVKGVYSYQTGGRLVGEVEGDLLKFKWQDPGSKEKAQRTMEGHGYLQIVQEDGKSKLKGEWGYGEDSTGAGPWTAEYIRELKSSDPQKVDDLEKSNSPPVP